MALFAKKIVLANKAQGGIGSVKMPDSGSDVEPNKKARKFMEELLTEKQKTVMKNEILRAKKFKEELTVAEVKKLLRENNMPTFLEQIRAEGKADGEARGKAEAISTVLKVRLEQVPKAVTDRVFKIGDLLVLDSLTQLAAMCDSMDVFVEGLP